MAAAVNQPENIPTTPKAPRLPRIPRMSISGRMGSIVAIEVVYVVILFAIALTYLTAGRTVLGVTLPSTLGPLPIAVPWFGALGAVMISLSAVFDHIKDWDPAWRYWHITRPLVGAALAMVSVLFFQAGVLAIGSHLPSTPATATSPSNLLYYAIAFIIGYREAIFRQLIKRVADVILVPGDTSSPASQPQPQPQPQPPAA